jgi:hypothetical protein
LDQASSSLTIQVLSAVHELERVGLSRKMPEMSKQTKHGRQRTSTRGRRNQPPQKIKLGVEMIAGRFEMIQLKGSPVV